MNMRRRAFVALKKEQLLSQCLLKKNGFDGALVTGLNLCGPHRLPNQGLACAIRLAEAGYKVIGHIDPRVKPETVEEISKYLKNQNASIVVASFGDMDWQREIVGEILKSKISNLQIICYESFTSYLSQERKSNPFLPFYEEVIDANVSQMMIQRVKGIQWLLKLVCNLFLVSKQEKVLFQSISALAAHRDGGNLFIDGLHKKIGSSALQSGLIDLSHILVEEELYAVEIMPGIVKGGYETPEVKNTLNCRSYNGVDNFKDINDWPEITPDEIADISFAYSNWFQGNEKSLMEAESSFQSYLWAGRCPEELSENSTSKLPDYCYLSDVQWGKLPEPKANCLVHVPLVPHGQLF